MTPEQDSEKTHADIWGEAPQFDNTHAVEGRGLAIDGAGGRWRGGSIWLLASQPPPHDRVPLEESVKVHHGRLKPVVLNNNERSKSATAP